MTHKHKILTCNELSLISSLYPTNWMIWIRVLIIKVIFDSLQKMPFLLIPGFSEHVFHLVCTASVETYGIMIADLKSWKLSDTLFLWRIEFQRSRKPGTLSLGWDCRLLYKFNPSSTDQYIVQSLSEMAQPCAQLLIRFMFRFHIYGLNNCEWQ